MDALPDTALSASSFLGQAFKPQFARLNAKANDISSGAWVSKSNSQNEFLQINYPQPTALFGIIVQGHPSFSQFVTSFKILHSFDGQVFHPLLDETKKQQIFGGSIDPRTMVKSLFKVPIEARVVRIAPITWSSSIAMRVELLGCLYTQAPTVGASLKLVSTPSPFIQVTTTTLPVMPVKVTTHIPPPQSVLLLANENVKPLCDDAMGVENGQMLSSQIKFSSMKPLSTVKNPKSKITFAEIVKLSSHKGWMPAFDLKTEYIMVS